MKLVLTVALLSSFSAFAQTKTTYDAVAPILKAKCLSCHSAESKAAGVDLSGYNEVLDFVVPSDAAQSDLWIQIASGNMPMGQAMTVQEKQLIKKWIVDGALPASKNR